jgi:FKBP-type peptidyl-prolyl cis-trans isomerase SlyD
MIDMTKVEQDKVATVHYTGTLPDTGETFDSSLDREPLTFLVGHKQMIPGFEAALMGSKVGDKVEFTLAPEDAYGEYDEQGIVSVESNMFGDITPEAGMVLMSDAGPFTVVEVEGDTVKVDFNHKLAGKSLHFSVEVIDLRDATEDEVGHGHAHGPGGHHH